MKSQQERKFKSDEEKEKANLKLEEEYEQLSKRLKELEEEFERKSKLIKQDMEILRGKMEPLYTCSNMFCNKPVFSFHSNPEYKELMKLNKMCIPCVNKI